MSWLAQKKYGNQLWICISWCPKASSRTAGKKLVGGAEKKTVEKGGHRTSLHRGNLSEEAQLSCKDADLVVETLRRRNSKIAD